MPFNTKNIQLENGVKELIKILKQKELSSGVKILTKEDIQTLKEKTNFQ